MEYDTDTLADAGRDVPQTKTVLDAKELAMARREIRQAQQGALLGLYQDGAISEDVFEKLITEINLPLSGSRASLLDEGEMTEPGIEKQNTNPEH